MGAENAMGTVQKRKQELGWGWNIRTHIPLLKLWLPAALWGEERAVSSLQACLLHVCRQLCLYSSPQSPPNTGMMQSHHILCYCHFVLIFMAMSGPHHCFSSISLIISSPTFSCSELPKREVGRHSPRWPPQSLLWQSSYSIWWEKQVQGPTWAWGKCWESQVLVHSVLWYLVSWKIGQS